MREGDWKIVVITVAIDDGDMTGLEERRKTCGSAFSFRGKVAEMVSALSGRKHKKKAVNKMEVAVTETATAASQTATLA